MHQNQVKEKYMDKGKKKKRNEHPNYTRKI